jgi:hypothetical protein
MPENGIPPVRIVLPLRDGGHYHTTAFSRRHAKGDTRVTQWQTPDRLMRADFCGRRLLARVCRESANGVGRADPFDAVVCCHRHSSIRYCITCHNARVRAGGLLLDDASRAPVAANVQAWEKVVRKLRTGMMPPAGMPRPDAATISAVVAALETDLDGAANAPPPGGPMVHRLNRAEYQNAIRDLLNVEIDGRAMLPGDSSDQGFDNLAAVLSVSPALLDRYLSAARKISRLAVGAQTTPDSATYQLGKNWDQNARMSEELPFGSSGGVAVSHEFPVDGEYTVRVRLQTNIYDYILGLGNRHEMDVRLDGARLQRFTLGGPEHGAPPPVGYAGSIFGDAQWEEVRTRGGRQPRGPVPCEGGAPSRGRVRSSRIRPGPQKAFVSRVKSGTAWRRTRKLTNSLALPA